MHFVIDTGPSTVTLRVSSQRQAAQSSPPALRRVTYPNAQEDPTASDNKDTCCRVYCGLHAFLFATAWSHFFFTTDMSVFPSIVQFLTPLFVGVAGAICFCLWQSDQRALLHLDGEDGMLVADRIRFPLSHVCFFHCAEVFVEHKPRHGTPSIHKHHVLEVVSLHEPILIKLNNKERDETAIKRSITHLDSFLHDWLQRTHAISPLPWQLLQQFRGLSGSVQIKRKSKLLRYRPQYCSLFIQQKDDTSILCNQRLPMSDSTIFFLRICAFGTLMWVLRLLVFLYRQSFPLHMQLRRKFVYMILAWAAPLLLVLAFHFRRTVWCMKPSGLIRYQTGWALLSIRRSYDVSTATSVTLDLEKAETPGSFNSDGTNKIGGRRFVLSWRDDEDRQLFKIEKLLGCEAVYLAEQVRGLYPRMFVEERNEESPA